MKKFVVYQHHRKDTGEVFYVGIGERHRPYRKDSRNPYWSNIVNKHGYDIEVIYQVDTWAQACVIEIMLIEKYGRKGIDPNGILTNRTKGGDGALGLIHNDDTINRLKEMFKGEKGALSKLTWEQIEEIRTTYRPYDREFSIRALSKKYKVGKSAINNIINNSTWVNSEFERTYHGAEPGNEQRRKSMSECMKKNHPFKGKKLPLTEEGRKKISETARGENQHMSALTEKDVLFIREHYKRNDKTYNYNTFAKMFNVTKGTIMYVVKRRTWKHI